MAGNRNEEMVYCSFCGKNQEEVKKIIAGNGVFICNECVALSQEIIREETAEEVLADLAETPAKRTFRYFEQLCRGARSCQTCLGSSCLQPL